MKATLAFTLPEESHEHAHALLGHLYAAALDDMDEWLRLKLKHGHDFNSIDEALQACRDELLSMAQEYGLRLHD